MLQQRDIVLVHRPIAETKDCSMHLSNPKLASTEPYVPGLTPDYVAQTYGLPPEDVAKLGSAENPFGPSPKALEAVRAARNLSIYPDWTARALREKIAGKYGFAADQVICGAGETEIISWIIRTFAGVGEKVLMFVPAFPIYHMFAEAEGRVPVYVEMGKDFEFAWEGFLGAIRPNIRIVFLTNPHSPTGRLISNDEIRRVCEAAKDQLVVLDEAYIHFTETNGGMDLIKEYPNLIALRTFSKAYGLAGLRLGFGIAAPEIIRPMMLIKPTWNMGALQVAAGIGALDDDGFVDRSVSAIVEMRAYVVDKIKSLNRFSVVGDPRSNFFLLRIEDESLELD